MGPSTDEYWSLGGVVTKSRLRFQAAALPLDLQNAIQKSAQRALRKIKLPFVRKQTRPVAR
jgi:hypothetical protein